MDSKGEHLLNRRSLLGAAFCEGFIAALAEPAVPHVWADNQGFVVLFTSAFRMLRISRGRTPMCDYSLMEYQNRLAVQGEFLIVHRFPTGSLGLASVHDCCVAETQAIRTKTFWATLKEFFQPGKKHSVPAVCIPPGASLSLHDLTPQVQKALAVGPDEVVTLVQLSGAAYTYRDAVRFRTGQALRLQDLREGQRLQVIDLGFGDIEEPNVSDIPDALQAGGLRLQSRR
jgi:hypothetical protein